MTSDDKINLLLGVCGVETAVRAADHVRVWRRLRRYSNAIDDRFAFTKAETVKDFFEGLITTDMNGGPLDVWLAQADGALQKFMKSQKKKSTMKNHRIVLDFYVDEFAFKIAVSRYVQMNDSDEVPDLRQSSTDTIEVTFSQPTPSNKEPYQSSRRGEGYSAGSRLIRRLDADNLRGWGKCLIE